MKLGQNWRFLGQNEEILHFFEKFMRKNLEVIKKCVPLQSHSGNTRGSSSVGRAQPCQGWGREFEPRLPLQIKSAEMLTLLLLHRQSR